MITIDWSKVPKVDDATSASKWIRELYNQTGGWHLDTQPRLVVDIATGEATFNVLDAKRIDKELDLVTKYHPDPHAVCVAWLMERLKVTEVARYICRSMRFSVNGITLDSMTVQSFREWNAEDPNVEDMVRKISALEVGGTVTFGGGAAAICVVERIA